MNKLRALVATLLAAGVLLSPGPAGAQNEVTWVQTLPVTGASGCIEYVAEWSDATSSSVPYECPPGAAVVRPDTGATADSSFPQLGYGGCTEYVANWSDGVTTRVPVRCPVGVVYPKPVPGEPPAQPAPPPVQIVAPPIAPPVTGGLEFVAVNGAPPGGLASVTVRTAPGALCSILYVSPSGALRAGPGLEQAMANENGIVTWVWAIERDSLTGYAFVAVSCNQQSGKADLIIG